MGNGMNYIREIMSMNLPDTPVEKTVEAAATEGFSRYQKVHTKETKFCGEYYFIGYLDDRSLLNTDNPNVTVRERYFGVGIAKTATPGQVIMHRNRLFAWCMARGNRGSWLEFNENRDTKYYGPRPEVSLIPKNKEENMAETRYDRIPYGYMSIKNVVFNNPATIVMWEDGSKTVVKCGENEEFDPEKGLAMAIAKKAFGNQGNYFNQFKKWLPKMEEGPVVNVDGGSILDSIRRVNEHIADVADSINHKFGSPKINLAKNRLAAAQELICDMSFNGATKAELTRAIRYSKELIDATKGVDVDINAAAKDYGIVELMAKYKSK